MWPKKKESRTSWSTHSSWVRQILNNNKHMRMYHNFRWYKEKIKQCKGKERWFYSLRLDDEERPLWWVFIWAGTQMKQRGVAGTGLFGKERLNAKVLRPGHCCVQGMVRKAVWVKWRKQGDRAGVDVGEEMGSGSWGFQSCKDFRF